MKTTWCSDCCKLHEVGKCEKPSDLMQLLDCPFCGKQPTYEEFRAWFYFYRIRCECGLSKDYVCNHESETEKSKAIKLWNTRAI